MLVVLFLVAACYAAPKHEPNRQALDDEAALSFAKKDSLEKMLDLERMKIQREADSSSESEEEDKIQGWKAYLGEVKVFVETVPTTTSHSVDGPNESTTITTTTFNTTVKKFIIVKEDANWGPAKSSCESIGAKLAEPKTEKQARFLGRHMDDGVYWIGGTCSDCIKSHDDKWEWVSGGHISLSHPMWKSYGKKQLPSDGGSNHDAFSLALARNSLSGNELTFVNYNEDTTGNIHGYICELA